MTARHNDQTVAAVTATETVTHMTAEAMTTTAGLKTVAIATEKEILAAATATGPVGGVVMRE